VSKVACGGWFSIILTAEGDVFSYGMNNAGELGLGEENIKLVLQPTQIKIRDAIVDIAC